MISSGWWKSAWSKLTLIPLFSILGLWFAIQTYKSGGAEELRTKVHQPLYEDLHNLAQGVAAPSPEKPPTTPKLEELKKNGAFERLPKSIKARVVRLDEEVRHMHSAVITSHDLIVREVSAHLLQMRSEAMDRAWQEGASRQIRNQAEAQKGISNSGRFPPMSHSGRSRSLDVRDPNHPILAGPGGPQFDMNDWLAYPTSLDTIDPLWTDLDYLYFNERDAWYYQLTRADLASHKITLREFLQPIYDTLARNPDFQWLLAHRSTLLSSLQSLKDMTADRIRDPKRLGDLATWD